MKTFIVIYYAPTSADQNMQADPKEMAGVMDAWMAWAKKVGSGMKDIGTPLGNGFQITKSGKDAPSKSNIVGYSIIQAESMDEAKALLKDHPHLSMPGACEIEVHESLPLPK